MQGLGGRTQAWGAGWEEGLSQARLAVTAAFVNTHSARYSHLHPLRRRPSSGPVSPYKAGISVPTLPGCYEDLVNGGLLQVRSLSLDLSSPRPHPIKDRKDSTNCYVLIPTAKTPLGSLQGFDKLLSSLDSTLPVLGLSLF